MPENDIDYDALKKPLYKLCDILIEKKLTIEGRGISRPISFPLKDLEPVVRLYNQNIENPHEKLEAEIKGLCDEEIIDDGLAVPLISVVNEGIFANFHRNFSQKKQIKLKYTRENLVRYREKLTRGDEVRRRNENFNKLIFHPGDCHLEYREKAITTKARTGNSNTRNILLLMFGHPSSIRDNNNNEVTISSETGSGYNIGDFVDVTLLRDIIFTDQETDKTILKRRRKLITDAIYNLNKRAKLALGIYIFNTSETPKVKICEEYL